MNELMKASAAQCAKVPYRTGADELLSQVGSLVDYAETVRAMAEERLSPILKGDFPASITAGADELHSPLFEQLRSRLVVVEATLRDIQHTLDRVDL